MTGKRHAAEQMIRKHGDVVLYVSPIPPPSGGIATWTRTLLSRGLPDGLRPVVVDTSTGEGRGVFQRAGLWSELRRAARVLRDFALALRRERPGFVHVNVDPMALGFHRDALCAALARLAGVPVAIHYRGQVAELEEQPHRRFQRWSVRTAARIVDLNLVLNERSRVFLESLLRGRGCVVQVPNYYDDRALPESRVEPRGPGEPLQVVFAGHLIRSKGVPELLETAELVPEVEFHLLGRRYPETDALLDAAPANVHVHGELPHAEALDRMVTSHVLLFPTRHREGFPNVVCEAMALGLAVVATPVGAIPEMVDPDRGGWLVEADPRALADALRRLERDDALRVAMGRHNREKAQRLYAYDRVVEKLVSLYRPGSGDPASG